MCIGLLCFGIGTTMECSQDGGILLVNQILLNSCSMTSRDFMGISLNIL